MTTRSSIQQKLANLHPNILRKDINQIVKIILSGITEALCGNAYTACELRNFGRFSTKIQRARSGRNPRTGEKIEVPSKRTIRWKCSKSLLSRLNKNFTE